ncbi:ROK family protein [Paenibacillus sacheonensis]|uniref:ROK family protein n=1 Tax=Paenibacillus sacheonensis TaxID=742054 RepID=A0A7X5C030_9BACL|nr:ROK family protein [Paenibacillus sacheonensis]MBM7565846.1 glucokinase [Paenibacillus sacheonensis]NBC68835.1 ROK family protein [Paenibacillus sacheonensis]
MSRIYAGVDVGGTGTVIGLFDEQRHLLVKVQLDTLGSNRERFGNADAYTRMVAQHIRDAVARLPGDPATLVAAGFGIPGQVNPEDGVVSDATNLGWRHVPFAWMMGDLLQVPVRIDHDVRTFAKGELMAGAAQGRSHAICLTIGTGIAAAIAIDGKLVRGGHNLAGEIGHDVVTGLTRQCPCGKIGCLETVVSGPGISRLAAAAGLTSWQNEGGIPTAEDVARHCSDLNEQALGIYRYAAELLAEKLETAVALLDPEVIVIGGGVAKAGEPFLGPIRERLHDRFPWLRGKLSVMHAELGDEAALIGAFHHAYEA